MSSIKNPNNYVKYTVEKKSSDPAFPFSMPPFPPPGYDFSDFSSYPYPPPPPFGYHPFPVSTSVSQPSLPQPPKTVVLSNSVTTQTSSDETFSPLSSPTSKPDEISPSTSSPPSSKAEDPVGFDMSRYAYEDAGRVARDVYMLVHPPEKEFLGAHMFFMLESPTARAIAEYKGKVTTAKENGGEACLANGEENALKDFSRRLAEVVWNCEAGWEMNASFVAEAQALMKTIDGLDHQATLVLKDCKPGQACYAQFKLSPLAASIDKQLSEIRKNQLIDLKVMADQSHVGSLYSLYKCNADMSDDIRMDVYAGVAKLNVCLSSAGLITTM